MENLRSKILNLSPEEFKTNVDAVAQSLLEKNKNLGEESSKYWNVIYNHTYMFKRLALIAAEVKLITVEEVLQFYDKNIVKGAPERKKLCVQVFAEQHMEKYEDAVADDVILIKPNGGISEFKRSMPLYELHEEVDVECFKPVSK